MVSPSTVVVVLLLVLSSSTAVVVSPSKVVVVRVVVSPSKVLVVVVVSPSTVVVVVVATLVVVVTPGGGDVEVEVVVVSPGLVERLVIVVVGRVVAPGASSICCWGATSWQMGTQHTKHKTGQQRQTREGHVKARSQGKKQFSTQGFLGPRAQPHWKQPGRRRRRGKTKNGTSNCNAGTRERKCTYPDAQPNQCRFPCMPLPIPIPIPIPM